MDATDSAISTAFARRRMARAMPLAAAVTIVLLLAACGSTPSGGGAAGGPEATTLRLGYLANLTQATPLVGLHKGLFAEAIGAGVKLKTSIFSAGPDAAEALLSDSIDATYIGPNPTINAFVRSHSAALRIVSGATSGGASLVVKPSINSIADLKGRTLASPQLGNTQDVALRWWLASKGLKTGLQGGGDVSIRPQENAQTLQTFRSGEIDGAWLPEPWATRLIVEGGAKTFQDERDLWPNGQFVTTQLVMRTDFLNRNPRLAQAFLRGHVRTTDFLRANALESQQVVNGALAATTGKRLTDQLVAAAWQRMSFTNDPVASSLRESADRAQQVGLLSKVDLKGIYDLTPLNRVLEASGQPAFKAP